MSEMQDAGRILLMPKGDYSADVTYEMLDIVNHNEASWVCKKECTGQEPSDSNTEFWQRFGTAVDLSNYLPLTGGKITANNSTPLELQSNASDACLQVFRKSDGNSLGMIGFEGSKPKVRVGGGSYNEMLHTGNMASYVVPLNNGTAIPIINTDAGTPLILNNITANNYCGIQYRIAGEKVGYIGFRGGYLQCEVQDGVWEDILHTGNKPNGSYTGNSSATERTIATNGIGQVCLVYSSQGVAIVTTSGVWTPDGFSTDAEFGGGNLVTRTTSKYLNDVNTMYLYQVV